MQGKVLFGYFDFWQALKEITFAMISKLYIEMHIPAFWKVKKSSPQKCLVS